MQENEIHDLSRDTVQPKDVARETVCDETAQECNALENDIANSQADGNAEVLKAYSTLKEYGVFDLCAHENEGVQSIVRHDSLSKIQDLLSKGKSVETIARILPSFLQNECIPNAREAELDTQIESSQEAITQIDSKIEDSQKEEQELAQIEATKDEKIDNLEESADEKDIRIAALESLVDAVYVSMSGQKLENFDEVAPAIIQVMANEQGWDNAKMEAIMGQANARIQPFLDLLDPSLTSNEVDRAIIAQTVNGLDLGSLPDRDKFVQVNIYGNEEISEETKKEIAQKLQIPRHGKINTGSKVQDAATTMMIDPETGASVPLYTENKNEAEVIEGVTTFTNDGSEVFLKAQVGGHTIKKDVTGWSAQAVGSYAEALGMWVATESFGATGFMESIYKIDFSFLENNVFDPLKIIEMKQKISYMVGGYEGYDGDIFDPQAKKGLIQAQMRALSGSNTAYGWENDQASTTKMVDQLGLDNLIVLKEFGSYSQANYLSGDISYADVHQHLYERFPALVEEPKA